MELDSFGLLMTNICFVSTVDHHVIEAIFYFVLSVFVFELDPIYLGINSHQLVEWLSFINMEKLPRRFPYLRIHLLLNLCKLILVNLEYTQKYEPYCPRHRRF